jgi:hypothetical protein
VFNIEKLILEIENITVNRFDIQKNSEVIDDILLSSDDTFIEKTSVRVRRSSNNSGGWRTILLASISDKEEILNVIKWAAACRDLLTEPEASDLYLFIEGARCNLSLEEATKIESSEQFCRKYVTRPDELLPEFLKRTFLQPLIGDDSDTRISDPLLDALKKTGEEHSWFIEKEQMLWRNAFLSGKTGSDLVDELFEPAITLGDL